ncbi:Glu/Leu/Phe/Val dehydrogenase dimerization domain-containing protein [Chondrinema litorale]|uniref:Glu/Leu/Phe/Val dehydrogenase dimerization domain-containing protein n=1 Tax=Chondrinema litorale TaxID=2994555 RepID=UPI0025437A10|nr:Glu/Leu/Phe/Val dehydrogenase dimerization domain-containing protein [Chondrinema litorale]UZR93402.1 leucine dehydrogenase [Chondrinema litorale]
MITEEKKGNSVFEQIAELGHEQVVFCHDESTGLKAIIGVHNTILGPAIGGTRMWVYEDESQALKDVLRLSRGMTFKNAVAGLNAGGGKAVIIGDARKHKSEALLRAFGNFIENLNGKYITAEDVGMTSRDMEYIHMQTKYVSGLPDYLGGLGDPSPFTAYGTYMGMKAAAKVAYGSDSLAGKKVAVQGVGAVGKILIDYLKKEKCIIYASDFYEDRLKEVTKQFNIEGVRLDEIYDIDVDIYSPCALGATINDNSLDRLKCDIIAGCANNQLEDEVKHGDKCVEKGVIYAPDFVVNSGGVINVYAEYIGKDVNWTTAYTEMIYDKSLSILEAAHSQKKNSQVVAMEVAMDRINSIRGIHY